MDLFDISFEKCLNMYKDKIDEIEKTHVDETNLADLKSYIQTLPVYKITHQYDELFDTIIYIHNTLAHLENTTK